MQPAAWLTVTVCPPAVIGADRAGPLFAATAKVTVPPPLPEPPETIDSQSTASLADHAQPAEVCTVNVCCPPEASTETAAGDTEKVQPCPWLTVKVRPAIVTEPDRFGPVVAATERPTVPPPLPLDPDVTVIQDVSLDAVQLHPAAADTATESAPPDAGTDPPSGEST